FVGFLDSLPALAPPILPRALANGLMGFGLLWAYQLHMSWVLLVPFTGAALVLQWREGFRAGPILGLLLGAAPMVALIAPTYFRYGFTTGGDVHGILSAVNARHVRALFDVAGKFLSFASFELPRFIGTSGREHFDYLRQHWPVLLPGAFLWI